MLWNSIRIAIAVFALAVLAAPAESQTYDSRGRVAKRQTVSRPPIHQWTGLYGGLNVGYGVAGVTDNAPLAVSSLMTGVVGGGQIGYNYQTGSLVLGVEADIQASDMNATYSRNLPFIGDFTVGHKIPYFGTLRGRIGYAFHCGCVMFYGTAGAAYGSYQPFASIAGVSLSRTYSNTALAVGAGVEWMVAERWSTKLEALYLDTGNIGSGVTLPFVGTVYARARSTITRIGINYHF